MSASERQHNRCLLLIEEWSVAHVQLACVCQCGLLQLCMHVQSFAGFLKRKPCIGRHLVNLLRIAAMGVWTWSIVYYRMHDIVFTGYCRKIQPYMAVVGTALPKS